MEKGGKSCFSLVQSPLAWKVLDHPIKVKLVLGWQLAVFTVFSPVKYDLVTLQQGQQPAKPQPFPEYFVIV